MKQDVITQCENAKEAALKLATLGKDVRNITLLELAEDILSNSNKIITANKKDIKENQGKISAVMLKRLKVDHQKIKDISEMVKSVAKLEDPIGKTLSKTILDKGLTLEKASVPIGVIACIFESRPEVVVQISALAIKSGNAVLLKGGSEALNTNRALASIIRKSIKDNKGVPVDAVQLFETREAIKKILKLDEFIDLIIPRGSNKLVKYIQDNTKIAVMGHADGICHVYIDSKASIDKAVKIAYDSKCQYPAVCNAMETLLIHKSIAKKILPLLAKEYSKENVELRGDAGTRKILKGIKKASDKDWSTEYTDFILSIKIVDSVDEAIDHINKYGSGHTDSIVTEDKKTAHKFLMFVDASSVVINASTRFADGYRYGLGAEVGISTNKIHARGPVGLEGLTIYKYLLVGNGHVVASYSGKDAKKFVHKKIK